MKKLLFILMVCTALTGCSNTNVEDKVSNETSKALAVLNAPEELIIDENFDVNSILADVQEGVEATYEVDEENSKIVITLTQGEQVETLEAPIMLASIEEPTETPEEPAETPAETVSNFPCTCVGTVDYLGFDVSGTTVTFVNEHETVTDVNYPGTQKTYFDTYDVKTGLESDGITFSKVNDYEIKSISGLTDQAGNPTYFYLKCDKPHPFQ